MRGGNQIVETSPLDLSKIWITGILLSKACQSSLTRMHTVQLRRRLGSQSSRFRKLLRLGTSTTLLPLIHTIIAVIATWLYVVASAAAFIFFGLNFDEKAVRGLIFSAVMPLALQGAPSVAWIVALWQ